MYARANGTNAVVWNQKRTDGDGVEADVGEEAGGGAGDDAAEAEGHEAAGLAPGAAEVGRVGLREHDHDHEEQHNQIERRGERVHRDRDLSRYDRTQVYFTRTKCECEYSTISVCNVCTSR